MQSRPIRGSLRSLRLFCQIVHASGSCRTRQERAFPAFDAALALGGTRVFNFPASKVDKFKYRYVFSVENEFKSIIDRTSGGIQ